MAPKNINGIKSLMGANGKSYAPGPSGGKVTSETIDERILRLLGLENEFELSYEEYIRHLKEALSVISLGKSRFSTEEAILFQTEFKRVKSKKKEDRFKVKKKKITASNVGLKKSSAIVKAQKVSRTIIKPERAKPERAKPAEKTETRSDKSITDNLKSINKTLDKVLKSLIGQSKDDKKRREKERTSSEKRKAQERESDLEKPFRVVRNLANKIIQPFRGILDSIFRFLGFTFLGWLVGKFNEIQKWTEQNKGKIEVVTRFLKDWWPSIAVAAGLFLTPLGGFIRGTLKMLRFFIPRIAGFILRHPIVFAGVVGGIAKINESKRMEPEVNKAQEDIDKTLQSKDAPWYEKLGASFADQSLNAPGGPKNPIGLSMPGSMYASGGSIKKYFSGLVGRNTGTSVSGFGKDTQAFALAGGGTAVLQPGETVLQVGARERMINQTGFDPLNFNVGPNANKPRHFGYEDGGIVGMQGGGILGAISKLGSAISGIGKRKPTRMQGGGLLHKTQSGISDFLGRLSIPGFGTAMTPKTGFYGVRSKLFGGSPIPGTQTYGNYSQADIDRYNKLNKNRRLQSGPLFYNDSNYGRDASPIRTNQRYQSPGYFTSDIRDAFVGEAFKNFGNNVKTLKDAARRQEEAMGQHGVKPTEYRNLFGQPVRRQGGGEITEARLGFTTKFDRLKDIFNLGKGSDKANNMVGLTAGLGVQSGETQITTDAMLGRGEQMKQTSPEVATQTALDNLVAGTSSGAFLGIPYALPALSNKPEIKRGLMGALNITGSSFYRGSPAPTPKVTTPEETSTSSGPSGQQSGATSGATIIAPGQQISAAEAYNKEMAAIEYRKDVMDSYTYGPGYYPSAGDAYNPDKIKAAYLARDRDMRIAAYRLKYGFNKGGVARFFNAGRVTTRTGYDIKGGIYGADTQYTPPMALKPGEDMYIIPSEAVPEMDTMVAKFDRNSNPAKNQGNLQKSGPNISVMNLPPSIVGRPGGSGGDSQPGKPQIKDIDVLMSTPMRMRVAEHLGIEDLV